MTQPLQRFLGSGDTLARLRDHSERLRKLQALLEQFLPAPLLEACSVANLKGDTLVLLARSGAAAARIKQSVPSLIGQFAAAGATVGSIQVRVALHGEPEPARAPQARILGEPGRQSLEALKNSLPDDAPLRESLERLLHRSRND